MIEETLKQRNKVHGNFEEDAVLAQELKERVRRTKNYEKLSPIQREALDHICTKLARILVGDPNFKDHWDDIVGYAMLVSQWLNPDLKFVGNYVDNGNPARTT